MNRQVKVGVVDHGTGNLTSLIRALEHVGASPVRLENPSDANGFDLACLPGVGAFPTVMNALQTDGWTEWIHSWVDSGKPLLGVCLGMQLLFERSNELGETGGLGLIKGDVTKLEAGGERLPHIGWSEVNWTAPTSISRGLEEGAAMYHVHSYACRPKSSDAVLATAQHGEVFVTAASNGENVFGVQFHPEKSSEDGLRLLTNFVELAKG